MIFTEKYSVLAYSIFQPIVPKLLPYFSHIKISLEKARMKVNIEEYVASFLLTSAILVPGLTLIGLLYLVTFAHIDILITVMLTVVIAALIFAAIFALYSAYPAYKVDSLKNALDKHIPFAAMHMATIAGTGVPPHVIFKMIGEFKEYGEVSKTCREIYRDISVLGYDTISAVSKEAQRTPSNTFRDLLWSIVAVIRSGGDLRQMLLLRAKTLIEDERRVEAKYIETLSMLAEIYSTVFVAGVVVIFVLVAMMGIIGGLPLPTGLVLKVTTYFLIPIASIAFILIIETTKPSGV
ncbi:MAG: type II secretion system F family protein [Candidatus Diapherotrites archaeon]|nr:type II secretion system F family protein [Candidatus Diapherotrites archaeon]